MTGDPVDRVDRQNELRGMFHDPLELERHACRVGITGVGRRIVEPILGVLLNAVAVIVEHLDSPAVLHRLPGFHVENRRRALRADVHG